MSLINRIPHDFYKLFTSKYTEYYMTFLVAIYDVLGSGPDGERMPGCYE